MTEEQRQEQSLAQTVDIRAQTPSKDQTGWWFHVYALALLADIGFFGYHGKTQVMGIAGGMIILGLIFSRLEMFKSFAGFGLKAEIREALQRAEKVSSEAYATAKQIRDLATALGTNSLLTLARTGIYAAMTVKARMAVAEEIRGTLERSGVTRNEISRMWEPLGHLIRHKHHLKILKAAQKEIGTEAKDVQRRMDLDGDFELLADFAKEFVAPASHFKKVLKDRKLLTGEVAEAVADLEYFEQERKLRRPELWEDDA